MWVWSSSPPVLTWIVMPSESLLYCGTSAESSRPGGVTRGNSESPQIKKKLLELTDEWKIGFLWQ